MANLFTKFGTQIKHLNIYFLIEFWVVCYIMSVQSFESIGFLFIIIWLYWYTTSTYSIAINDTFSMSVLSKTYNLNGFNTTMSSVCRWLNGRIFTPFTSGYLPWLWYIEKSPVQIHLGVWNVKKLVKKPVEGTMLVFVVGAVTTMRKDVFLTKILFKPLYLELSMFLQ